MSRRTKQLENEEKLDHFRVAIFGSARIKKGDKTYKLVYDLAKRIGTRRMDAITGGGPGLMEAANKGHKKGSNGKAHSLGLLIKLPFEAKSNVHLDIKKEFEHFSNRLDHFMSLSNVVVVAPGGIGTLLELYYTWQLVQVSHICNTPIILLGEMWDDLTDWMEKKQLKKGYISKENFDFIFHAKTCPSAMKIIDETFEQYMRDGENICLNMKKYKIHKKGKK